MHGASDALGVEGEECPAEVWTKGYDLRTRKVDVKYAIQSRA
jgi:hypothetical protein